MKILRNNFLYFFLNFISISSIAQSSNQVIDMGNKMANTYQKQLPEKTLRFLKSKNYSSIIELSNTSLNPKSYHEALALAMLINAFENTIDKQKNLSGIAQLPYLQARRYGLVVTDKIDERLLPDKSLIALSQWYAEVKIALKSEELARAFILKTTCYFQGTISKSLWNDLMAFTAQLSAQQKKTADITEMVLEFPIDKKFAEEVCGPLFNNYNPHIISKIIPANQIIRVADGCKSTLLSQAKPVEIQKEEPPKPPKQEYIIHKVRPGETLSAISRKYGVNVREIKSANNLISDRINSGQKLKIPGNETQANSKTKSSEKVVESTQKQDLSKKRKLIHEVMPGETLYSISKQYPGVSYEEIKVWNNLGDLIYPGQKIVIFVNK